jgi:O-antigen/teichoic acid export membrane protein
VTGRGGVRDFWRSGSSMAVSISIANVATYGFTVVAARALGPHEYGAVAALLAAILVVGVVQLGLQATAARRVSAEPEHRAEIEHEIVRVGWRAALGLGLLLLVLSPVVERLLRLDSVVTAVWLAVAAVPLTLMGAQAGILQGERRWGALSLVYLAVGIPRVAVGGAFIAWRPDQTAAIAGVALGAVFPTVVGWWALRSGARFAPEQTLPDERRHPTRDVLGEIAHNSQALLAFLALSNADILVARHALDSHRAGIYAAGLILAKAMLFLPQFVVIVAFPSMSTTSGRGPALRRSLLLVGLLGVVGTLGALFLHSPALVFVGGSAYAEVADRLWLFALLGTILSMLQLLVYAVLARSGRRPVLLVWAAFVVVLLVGLTTSSVTGLLTLVLACDTTLLVALLLTDARGLGNVESPDEAPPIAA